MNNSSLNRAQRKVCDWSPNGSICIHGCEEDECMKFDEMKDKRGSTRTVTVPQGWVVVPLEPTHEMIYRGHEAWKGRYGKGTDQTNEDIYKAMVNAAPKL